jgi:hypothetical protein
MQKRYSVERNGKWSTFYSCNSPVGAAREAFDIPRPFSWKTDPNTSPWASHTIVNETIHVYEHKL